jgi:hypothetical protein
VERVETVIAHIRIKEPRHRDVDFPGLCSFGAGLRNGFLYVPYAREGIRPDAYLDERDAARVPTFRGREVPTPSGCVGDADPIPQRDSWLRSDKSIGEEDEEFALVRIGFEVRSESTDRAVIRGVTDYARDPRERERDFRRLLGTSNDRGRDTVEKPLVPRVNGEPARLNEKLIRAAEPGRLTRCENDRITNHGRDS